MWVESATRNRPTRDDRSRFPSGLSLLDDIFGCPQNVRVVCSCRFVEAVRHSRNVSRSKTTVNFIWKTTCIPQEFHPKSGSFAPEKGNRTVFSARYLTGGASSLTTRTLTPKKKKNAEVFELVFVCPAHTLCFCASFTCWLLPQVLITDWTSSASNWIILAVLWWCHLFFTQ